MLPRMKAEMGAKYIISGLSLPYTAEDEEFLALAKTKMKRAASAARFRFFVYKRSIDARKKNDIRVVCSVAAESEEKLGAATEEKLARLGIRKAEEPASPPPRGEERLGARPLVVGAGPAGMLCALTLAENGYKPVLIDRGGSVVQRVRASEMLRVDGELDKETNIQFGAGGAGTFSDGKLTTRINDPICALVLEKLLENGAPADIMTKAKPHIGTDVLRIVVENILSRIEELGGTVVLNCKLCGIDKNADGTLTAKTSGGDINCGCAVLAVGHSARDTYTMLRTCGYELVPKPFSVGVRIEHLREDIDQALYGEFAGDIRLGAAEYNFSDTTGERGVYTFCMCPGGEVVAATTEDGGVVVNGMSYRDRDGRNSNSAINVSVNCADYGNTVDGAIEFQRKIERAAFASGGGKFYAPVQTVGDFLSGRLEHEPKRILPSYMGGDRCRVCDLHGIFPEYITSSLDRGITSFGKKLSGFDARDAVLTAPETRTSAPVRIVRGELGNAALCDRVYPCGEGAGYAGGIMSAAVDGIKTAYKIIQRFCE